MTKAKVEFEWDFRNWLDPKETMIDLIETLYNQLLPIIGTLFLISGNFYGVIFFLPLILKLELKTDKKK